ncbi:MAG: type II secretion system F family protein [Faecalibacterium sp.]
MKKATKKKPTQWTTNPLNEKVLDYRFYEMTSAEKIAYFLIAFLVGGIVSQFFYGGLFQSDGEPTGLTYISNTVAFVVVGFVVAVVFLPVRSRQLAEKRRSLLRKQFRDMLESLTASLAAGSTVKDAFTMAYKDMCLQYSEEALISLELDEFRRAEQINVTLDVMMNDFAMRSGVEEIQDFNNVFQVCYGPGGNMSRVIHQTHDIICERMEIEDEIDAKIHANEMELNIIMLAPVLIVALMRGTNENFAQNLASPIGVAAVTGALVMFAAAYIWGQKIIAVR